MAFDLRSSTTAGGFLQLKIARENAEVCLASEHSHVLLFLSLPMKRAFVSDDNRLQGTLVRNVRLSFLHQALANSRPPRPSLNLSHRFSS